MKKETIAKLIKIHSQKENIKWIQNVYDENDELRIKNSLLKNQLIECIERMYLEKQKLESENEFLKNQLNGKFAEAMAKTESITENAAKDLADVLKLRAENEGLKSKLLSLRNELQLQLGSPCGECDWLIKLANEEV